jgi:hypothetical protein
MRMQTILGPVAAALLLAGCNASGNPFANPFGSSQLRPQPASVAQPAPAPQPSGTARPSVAINAPVKKVQDTIIARAQRRGTTILGANNTGVTLEIPLKQSSEVVVQQCGEHREGRALRVYLETLPDGAGATVNEQRFVVDGAQACQLALTPGDIEGANKSLGDLKQESENTRTAASGSRAPAARPADPAGGLEPVNPSRPVQPLR